MKKLLLLGMFLAFAIPASAADIYYAAASAGGNTGVDCANAFALPVSSWVAGNTYHLCGTISMSAGTSGGISVGGSGTFGNLITIKFETNAILQAPYWGANGAILISGRSYVTVDGGTNGLIQATLNGTAGGSCPGGTCSNQQSGGEGVYITSAADNIEVKNIIIANLYVRSPGSDAFSSGLHNPWCVGTFGTATNITIDHMTCHDVNWGVFIIWSGVATSNISIHDNTVYNVSLGFAGGDGASGATLTGPLNIYNNVIHDMSNWDLTANHHDGIYFWVTNASSSFMGAYNVYNNYIYNLGTTCTAPIYFDPGATATYPNGTAFNNVLDGGTCGDGSVFDKSGKMRLYNNTIVTGSLVTASSGTGQLLENNVSGATVGITDQNNTPITTSDYNDWYNLSNPAMYYGASTYASFSAYKTGTGFDAHSITSNPNLTGFIPNAGSPVIGAGVNLNATCNGQPNPGLGALCLDKVGVTRPTSAAWDIGAYQYAGGQQAATPTFSLAPGTYGSAQPNTLSTTSTGAIICLTTDGTTPVTDNVSGCTNGTKVTTIQTVSVTGTWKAVAGGTGFSDSAVGSALYTIGGAPAVPPAPSIRMMLAKY